MEIAPESSQLMTVLAAGTILASVRLVPFRRVDIAGCANERQGTLLGATADNRLETRLNARTWTDAGCRTLNIACKAQQPDPYPLVEVIERHDQ